jgi:hypothetical protein
MSDGLTLSSGLRIRIVGYASPRWASSKSAEEADRRNFVLSTKRAETVHALMEKMLRNQLGDGIKIEYAVSHSEPRNPQGIEFGSHGAGSFDALTAAHGDRKDNSAKARRAEVIIEKITTHGTTSTISLPPQRVPGQSTSWALGVTKLRALAFGGAAALVEVVLRNRLTDKRMHATAELYGGGLGGGVAKAGGELKKQLINTVKNNLMQAAADFIGRGEVYFTTKSKMSFRDFDGEFLRMGKAAASLGVKSVYSYAVFPFIDHHPAMLVFERKVGWGLIDLEGWIVAGKLRLRGTNPGDWWEYDRADERPESYDALQSDRLVLTFATGRHDLSAAERSRLEAFVTTWARRFA